MAVGRLRRIHFEQGQFLGCRQRLGFSNYRLDLGRQLVAAVEVPMSDGEVEQNGEAELQQLDAQRQAVRSPAQLIGVEQQTTSGSSGVARRRVAVSLPQPTRRVDYQSEQHRCRDVTLTTPRRIIASVMEVNYS